MKHEKPVLLGAHMSISGGLYKAIIEGDRIGCTAIQLFTKNNRQWSFDTLKDEECQLFKETLRTSSIKVVVSHACYLINLGSQDKDVREKSIRALHAELMRCYQLGIENVVLHPGSAGGLPPEESLLLVAENLDKAFEGVPSSVHVALETMAGQGSSLGTYFEDLASIIHHVHHKHRMRVCVDTCHIHAAGYNIDSPDAYKRFWSEFDKIIGRERLSVIHVNDSKKPCGSRVDRHAHIHEGTISDVVFECLMNDAHLATIPKILETPKEKDLADDVKNMNRLRALVL